MLKKVAIVGRTNVGKSTLFNRLVGRRKAIVHDYAGVTRDRQESVAHLSDLNFTLIDTAGLEKNGELSEMMWQQTQKAIQDADVILMIVDSKTGLSVLDKQLAQELRRTSKPVILVANKTENTADGIVASQAYELGLGEPVAISAEHGLGLADLYSALSAYISPEDKEEKVWDEEAPLHLAIIGRPNVGKSTLINQLLKEDRLLTGPQAGMTRDSISLPFMWKEHKVILTDTAGLRKQARVKDSLEKMMVSDTQHVLNLSQVVVVMVDATAPLEAQDVHLASQVIEEGRAIILAINKWDMIPVKAQNKLRNDIKELLRTSLQQVKGMPVVYISAKTGMGMDLLMKEVFSIYAIWNKRVPTAKLNEWLRKMVEATPPPLASNGRRIPMKYMTQVATRPPTFVIFSSNPDNLPESYLRYLSNGLRKDYGLEGVPIRINMRKRKNPYVEK